jgi:hypothetical protein
LALHIDTEGNMVLRYSAKILNENIGPGVSDFVAAEIPNASQFSGESEHWVTNFFLNCTFRGAFAPPMHAYAYNFLRRAQNAFSEHRLAREHTLNFLGPDGKEIKRYVAALYHWESFLGQAWHAYALLAKAWDSNVFDKNDGSVQQRLNALYNQMKHVESRIENGQILCNATVPVWLENQGIRSIDTHLTFEETAEVLKELAKIADALTDPATAYDKLGDYSE